MIAKAESKTNQWKSLQAKPKPINGKAYKQKQNHMEKPTSKTIKSLQVQLDLFKDYSQEDQRLYAKAQSSKSQIRQKHS